MELKTICYLIEDQFEFLGECRLKDLVKKRSEFIGSPIEEVTVKSRKRVQSNDTKCAIQRARVSRPMISRLQEA